MINSSLFKQEETVWKKVFVEERALEQESEDLCLHAGWEGKGVVDQDCKQLPTLHSPILSSEWYIQVFAELMTVQVQTTLLSHPETRYQNFGQRKVSGRHMRNIR